MIALIRTEDPGVADLEGLIERYAAKRLDTKPTTEQLATEAAIARLARTYGASVDELLRLEHQSSLTIAA